jgi:hypothetical protein
MKKLICILFTFLFIFVAVKCNEDDIFQITEIKVNKAETTLDPGTAEQLTATVVPDNATSKRVLWSSSDPNIAAVNNLGIVNAIYPGTVDITVTTPDKTVSNQVKVTVNDLDHAKKIIGIYPGVVAMDGTPVANNIPITLSYASYNVIKLESAEIFVGVRIKVTAEALSVTDDKQGKYLIAGNGITNNFGYGPKPVTIKGFVDGSNNLEITEMKIESISQTITFKGQKQ